jgi:hypothetical protein
LPKGKTANDLKAWDAAIDRAKSNLAHQMLRNTNADLQLRHASNAHKVPSLVVLLQLVAYALQVHNFVLEALQMSAQVPAAPFTSAQCKTNKP